MLLTLIFYYSDKEWTAGKCIHDLIKWPEEPEIKSIVPNYKLNLLWAYQINNIDKYKSDLQYILSMLKYKEEEKSLKQYISDNNDKIQNMNQDSHNVAVALLNQNLPKLIDNMSNKIDIKKLIQKDVLIRKFSSKLEGFYRVSIGTKEQNQKFLEALKEGGLIKAPVINVKANLKDGKQHSVDSNEIAFKNAAILAFKEAYKKCNPIILEPYDKIIVIVPSEYLGAILSDLTKRRARILSTDEDEGVNLKVTAIVPESEILEYSNEIKSLSKSTAFFNLSFYDYEQVPELISNKILATYNNEKK